MGFNRFSGVSVDGSGLQVVFGHPETLLEPPQLVGESFGVARVTNPNADNILDFSIPPADSKVDKGHRGFRVTGDATMSVPGIWGGAG